MHFLPVLLHIFRADFVACLCEFNAKLVLNLLIWLSILKVLNQMVSPPTNEHIASRLNRPSQVCIANKVSTANTAQHILDLDFAPTLFYCFECFSDNCLTPHTVDVLVEGTRTHRQGIKFLLGQDCQNQCYVQ